MPDPRPAGKLQRGQAVYQALIPELATVTPSRRAREPRPRTATSTSGYAAATSPVSHEVVLTAQGP
jgi:hypothetical protein